MSAATFADWLGAIQITPVTPEKTPGVQAKNAAVIGENAQITPITPVTPQNQQGQTENAETRAAMPVWPQQPAPLATSVPALPSTAPAPRMGWLHVAQPWRELDRQYLAHWGRCPICKTAARGHSERCATGQHLHADYLAALALV